MELKYPIKLIKKLMVCMALLHTCHLSAQTCHFKDTLFSIDFGTGKQIQEFNLNAMKNYRRDYTSCSNDGFYAYTSMTSNCFNSDWFTLNEDHTVGDYEGKMMLVNASEKAAGFFIATLSGLKPGAKYEFAVWLLNVCKINGGCKPLPPDILIALETISGKTLAAFPTGKLYQSAEPLWKRCYGLFTCPTDVTAIVIKMYNTTNGGCGNDFAMDDITLRECYPPPPPVAVQAPKPKLVEAVKIAEENPILKKITPENRSIIKSNKPVSAGPARDTPIPVAVSRTNSGTLPLPLLTRSNPVIKQIETDDAELLIEIYDNGEIDGDTVSIYHNNELIVSRQGLSAKPVSFKIKVDSAQPHHEIVMVADNLGSIPPNTSLMVVTGNGKRFEIFISSSEQKNAKLVIKRQQ